MKLKKTELNFNQLMELNVKIKKNIISNIVLNDDMLEVIKEKMLSVSRVRNKCNITYCKNGMPTLHWNTNKGWTCMTLDSKIVGNILVLTKVNGDTNKKDMYYFEIQ